MNSRRIFGVANVVMIALFLLSAALQINDPDPLAWIAIYVVAAAVSLAVWQRESLWPAALVLCIGTVAWGLWLLLPIWGTVGPSELFEEMEYKGGAVEVGREAVGLLIVASWLMVVALVQSRRARRKQ